jgi:hypothetical protein
MYNNENRDFGIGISQYHLWGWGVHKREEIFLGFTFF